MESRSGRFVVRDGREIRVEPADTADPADVEAALWGTAMAVLLQQRGVLPLHVAAVTVRGQGIGFVGPPGIGKSSLACALAEHGHRLVTDDLGALTYDATGRPALHPGPPSVRIWGSTARRLDWPTDESHRLKAGIDKFAYDLQGRSVEGPRTLAAMYALTEAPVRDAMIRPMSGFEKFEVLHAGATYNREYLDTPELREWHFREVCRLAAQVPLFLIARPSGDWDLDDVASRVEQHWATIGEG